MTRMLDAGATQVNAMTMRYITRYFQTCRPMLSNWRCSPRQTAWPTSQTVWIPPSSNVNARW